MALTDLLTTEPSALHPVAQVLQNMEEMQAEQKRMEIQSESWGRGGGACPRAMGTSRPSGLTPDTCPTPPPHQTLISLGTWMGL